MKNTLGDLNNHLFMQMERLSSEELKGESLKEEMARGNAISKLASNIINNANLVLQAQKFRDDKYDADAEVPKMLEG